MATRCCRMHTQFARALALTQQGHQVFADIVAKFDTAQVVQVIFWHVEGATTATVCSRKPFLHCSHLLSLCLTQPDQQVSS